MGAASGGSGARRSWSRAAGKLGTSPIQPEWRTPILKPSPLPSPLRPGVCRPSWRGPRTGGVCASLDPITILGTMVVRLGITTMGPDVQQQIQLLQQQMNNFSQLLSRVLNSQPARPGKFEAALEIMGNMQEAGIQPDKAACNILIQKCSIAGETSAMNHILYYMKEHSIVLRRPIYLEALEALKSSGESDHLLREVNPHLSSEGIEDELLDFQLSAADTAALIDRGIVVCLLARGNWIAIDLVLSELVDKETQLDSELISAVVQANCVNQRLSGALTAFRYCIKTGQKLDRSAYICLIGLFIRNSSFEVVLEVVEEMLKVGISLGTHLVFLLIHKLGCVGLTSYAAKIFNYLPREHNTVTCTAMMDAYFHGNEIEKGLEVYCRMRRQGIPVSFGTYEVLVVGLEEAGRIQDAEMFRKEKKRLHWHDHSRKSVSTEESLCNVLFNRDRV